MKKPKRKFSEKWWCAVLKMPGGGVHLFTQTIALTRDYTKTRYTTKAKP